VHGGVPPSRTAALELQQAGAESETDGCPERNMSADERVAVGGSQNRACRGHHGGWVADQGMRRPQAAVASAVMHRTPTRANDPDDAASADPEPPGEG
jgi:hypothetical protein